MNILITGGNGYLGGKLCEILSKNKDHYVRIASRKKIFALNSDVQTVICNWEDNNSIINCCKDIDIIVHLAAMNAEECKKDPISAINVNIMNTARLIEAAKKVKVKKFIYISTAHVYGNPLQGTIDENKCPNPNDIYAITHRAAEDLVKSANILGYFVGVNLRLSNAFGAPVNLHANCWGLLFNDLCKQVVQNNEMNLRTNGLQRRDFITITDAIQAIVYICKFSFNQYTPRLFNIGGDWTPTIWEATNLIADRYEIKTGKRPKLNRINPKYDDQQYEFKYESNLIEQIGYKKEKKIHHEIDELINFCKDQF